LRLSSFRTVQVDLTNYKLTSATSRLARCLKLFTNLQTVKLNILRSSVDTASRKAFGKHQFPQITSVIVSHVAYPLIGSCPNLKSLQLIAGYTTSRRIWSEYINPSKHIQNLTVAIYRSYFEGGCKKRFSYRREG